jgi:hypothetical protein
MIRTLRLLAPLTLALAAGCVGNARETTTPRTSTEQLLVSTAAERAVGRLDEKVLAALRGRRVIIDESRYESYDKPYVMSALRHRLAEEDVILAPGPDKDQKAPAPERVVEVRSGGLGVNDDTFGLGIPALPLPIPNTTLVSTTPALYLFFRDKQQGWAKFQIWVWDRATGEYVASSGDLWGHAYYSQWWFFFVGPFDFSNDIYPHGDALERASTPRARR